MERRLMIGKSVRLLPSYNLLYTTGIDVLQSRKSRENLSPMLEGLWRVMANPIRKKMICGIKAMAMMLSGATGWHDMLWTG
jgi:hypothetical protein